LVEEDVALLWNDTAAPDEALDFLASLEERIARAVESLNSLRAENQALREELAELRNSQQAAVARVSQMEEELRQTSEHRTLADQSLENLRNERRQVKTRIEKLLGQLETLGQ
jgi:chromosome segregation protein